MLDTPFSVERALTRYTDPLQPRTGSVTTLGRGTGARSSSPFHPALLGELEERGELRRRMAWIGAEEAVVVFRWYVEGATPEVIARDMGRSLRHVYRRRGSAIEAIIDLGRGDDFSDADVDEFR